MRTLGLDMGSRAIKVALVEDGGPPLLKTAPGGWDPLQVCAGLLEGEQWDAMAVTGYGRHLGARHYACPAITELKAVALGAVRLHPEVRGVVDVGGQDTKALSLDGGGKMRKFAMNDRCAAGTGRFLEVMATAMGLRLEEFVATALAADGAEQLSSLCAVFAESEAVSLIGRGAGRDRLARGIHRSVAQRILAQVRGLALEGPVLFTGGGALNRCLEHELAAGGLALVRAAHPQHVAALGCALAAGAKPVPSRS
ncbi:MAG: acyl-CoA dehydratase activase [bacterium]|jgi:predicted CoA-substrate-specific enzyme activase|nr:acyl-CoA dehydratase activase [bacterium]